MSGFGWETTSGHHRLPAALEFLLEQTPVPPDVLALPEARRGLGEGQRAIRTVAHHLSRYLRGGRYEPLSASRTLPGRRNHLHLLLVNTARVHPLVWHDPAAEDAAYRDSGFAVCEIAGHRIPLCCEHWSGGEGREAFDRDPRCASTASSDPPAAGLPAEVIGDPVRRPPRELSDHAYVFGTLRVRHLSPVDRRARVTEPQPRHPMAGVSSGQGRGGGRRPRKRQRGEQRAGKGTFVPTRHRWSRKEIDMVAARYRSGASLTELSGDAGCDWRVMRQALLGAGIVLRTRRHLAAEEIGALATRYQQGATLRELARDTGYSVTAIRRALLVAGATMRPRGGRPHRNDQPTVDRR